MTNKTTEKIERLRRESNAVILAHNYQVGSVQGLADHRGDSLGLSRTATEVDADVIVFCGVYFMAETAAILNPGRTVLIPEKEAGCPMARMTSPDRLAELKADHPDAAVVTYVNSTAEMKALSDICCTSSNAVDVVNSIEPGRPVIFTPDQHLGRYVAEQTGRELILDRGYCPTHVRIRPEHIRELRRLYPEAEVMVHPECRREVVEEADVVTSTGGMLRYAGSTDAPVLIVGTEVGLIYRLRQENPDKEFIPATSAAVCPNMKRITVGSVLRSLEEMQYEVTVPEDIREPAARAIERMLAIGRGESEGRRALSSAEA
ncbi:MAG: quinolinate synthase NadA [Candidatus Brocadiia bacterium]